MIIVVYTAPDGSYEEYKTTVNENKTISFETDRFSRYAIIGINDKGGISAGAVIGIVIGSVILLGLGGGAIFWFVIKKKSLDELIALVKRNPSAVESASEKSTTDESGE